MIATTQELPDEFPLIEEMNDGHPIGISWLQSTIAHSVRTSSATAYLPSDVRGRDSLDILIGTRVTRLIQTATVDGVPEFAAVEIAGNITAGELIRAVYILISKLIQIYCGLSTFYTACAS